MLPPAELTWDLAEPSLLALATGDLDAGAFPRPRLVAFAGTEPLAVAGFRPFGPGEAVQALIELLALLVPIGANRVALALPGRAWSLGDDPAHLPEQIPPGAPTPVVVVTRADAHHLRPAEQATTLHPFEVEDHGWRWGDSFAPPGPAEGEVAVALATILDGRGNVVGRRRHRLELPAQLGRVLMLGHELALAPAAAAQLDPLPPGPIQ